jgi:hypothetical protein
MKEKDISEIYLNAEGEFVFPERLWNEIAKLGDPQEIITGWVQEFIDTFKNQ